MGDGAIARGDSAIKEKLLAEVQKLEVSCAELNSLPSGRSVYEKKGAIFFRTEAKVLITTQQRELKKTRNRLNKL